MFFPISVEGTHKIQLIHYIRKKKSHKNIPFAILLFAIASTLQKTVLDRPICSCAVASPWAPLWCPAPPPFDPRRGRGGAAARPPWGAAGSVYTILYLHL